MLTALVPVKPFRQAKQRLAAVLGDEARAALALAMLRDTLHTLAHTPEVGRVLVITADASAQAVATRAGADTIHDASLDLNRALVSAVRPAARGGASQLAVLPTDLPQMCGADVSKLFEAHRERGDHMTVAVARRDAGTNGLMITPPERAIFRFGPTSSARHLEAARDAGLRASSLVVEGLADDLDTPADVAAFLSQRRTGCVWECLARSGAAERGSGSPNLVELAR